MARLLFECANGVDSTRGIRIAGVDDVPSFIEARLNEYDGHVV